MIGLATIGQSPRNDVLPSMFSEQAQRQIEQAGALDCLTREQIAELQPTAGEHPLVTRLATGEEVVIAKERVIPHLIDAVRSLEDRQCTTVCVLCTGEFNLPEDNARLVYPDRLIGNIVESVLPSGRIGVLMPHPGQAGSMRRKWQNGQREVCVQVLSPYDAQAAIDEPLKELARAQVDLAVLDCMGYNKDLQRTAARILDVPVILSNRTVGAVIESMVVQSEDR